MRRVFNLSNVYSSLSFCSLILSTGAVEGEMYLTALALIAGCAVTAWLALREDGKGGR